MKHQDQLSRRTLLRHGLFGVCGLTFSPGWNVFAEPGKSRAEDAWKTGWPMFTGPCGRDGRIHGYDLRKPVM